MKARAVRAHGRPLPVVLFALRQSTCARAWMRGSNDESSTGYKKLVLNELALMRRSFLYMQ